MLNANKSEVIRTTTSTTEIQRRESLRMKKEK